MSLNSNRSVIFFREVILEGLVKGPKGWIGQSFKFQAGFSGHVHSITGMSVNLPNIDQRLNALRSEIATQRLSAVEVLQFCIDFLSQSAGEPLHTGRLFEIGQKDGWVWSHKQELQKIFCHFVPVSYLNAKNQVVGFEAQVFTTLPQKSQIKKTDFNHVAEQVCLKTYPQANFIEREVVMDWVRHLPTPIRESVMAVEIQREKSSAFSLVFKN